ncbi:MAG TPA: DMT family transporter [Brevundimonas sp.]|uniref:DMT family transporter n=1 Tax=Brevundimonas sp. TaxID=1871086 RepID=UPI002DE63401|nr:DMT family transporter [Brevundimonas sp.]
MPPSADASPADRRLAMIVLVAAAMVLGLAPILVRLAEVGPAAAGMWRFAFSLPLLLILTARPGGDGVGRPSKWMALAGLFFVLDLGFWHYGIVMTSVANATTLCNLTPVVVTAFAWIVWGQRPSRMFLIALALAMLGALAMAAGADGGQGSNPLLGDVFSLSVALWYAGYFLAVQAARRTAGALRVTLWSTALGLPLLLIAALALREDLTPETAGGWAALAGLGVMHVVGQGGVAWALGRLPASVTAVTILVQPVVAALLGWVLFAEALTPVQALGGALVLGAVVLAQRSAQKKAGAEPESPAPAGS